MKRKAVKVYLSREQIEMLDRACRAVGEDRSRYIQMLLLTHFREINLIREAIHRGKNIPYRP